MRILVTDGGTRTALAVTRSLARAGHEVIVGEKRPRPLAQASRYCSAGTVYPDPAAASESFIDYVAGFVRDRQIEVIVPVADVTTLLVAAHRDRFEPACAVPVGSYDVVARAADKVNVVATAASIGVPIPRSVVVPSRGAIPDVDFGYPFVIKPGRSRVRTDRGWKSTAVSFANDRAALLRDLASRPEHEFPVLVQERIVGPGLGVFACYQGGRPVALFSHRRLREQPPWGGVSVLSESVPLDPVARDYAVRLLEAIGWQGIAMVEFKQDHRDGLPKLMEINGRFWGSLQLAIDAGVDFPALLVRSLQPAPLESMPYRVGIRSRWLWGDIDALLLVLLGRARSMGVRRSRLRALADFLWCFGRDLYYENPRWDDLGPWWHETRERLSFVGRAVAAREPQVTGRQTDHDAGATESARRDTSRTVTGVFRSIDQVGLDDQAWNALASTSETNTVFQTYQWARSWCETFATVQEPLFVVASRGQRTIGIAPLAIERRPLGRRVVRFLGANRGDYCDLIAGQHKQDVVTALMESLADHGQWDTLELDSVPDASGTADLIRSACARVGFRVLVSEQCACPTLLIQGQEHQARLLKDRASMRRRLNYFCRSGTLAFRDLTTHTEVEPFLEEFFQQHIARWAAAGTPSLFLDPRNVAFYRALTARMSPTGWLLFSVAELNGEPIAFHYGFDYGGSLLWYKPSFDVKHAQHSPGLVMMGHLIGYAIEHGRRELDFTVGDEAFKRRFTNHIRHNLRIQVFRDPLDYAIERSKRALVSNVKRLAGH